MQQRVAPRQEILRPAGSGVVYFSLAAALAINLLPWQGTALLLRPDFVALAVLYWCVYQPRSIGFGMAWGLGLLMDAADGALLGQHALAYGAITFAGMILQRRILMFGMGQQMLHALPVLLGGQGIVLLVALASDGTFPGWGWFSGSLIGAALWPPLVAILRMPQRPRRDPDQA